MLRQLASSSLRNKASKQPLFANYGRVNLPQVILSRSLHATVPSQKKEEPLAPSLIEKYKLDLPSRWVPLVVGAFGTASLTGLYHWDEESQMLGLFVLFVGTIYSQAGGAIARFFDETSEAILKEHNAVEDTQIQAVKLTLEAHKKQVAIYEDIKSIFEEQKNLMNEVASSAGKRLQLEVRNSFVKKLDTIVQMESAMNASLQATLVSNATASVKKAFESGDNNLKNAALMNAINVLRSGGQATGKDALVGDLYTSYFKQFRESVNAAAGKEHELDAKSLEEVNDVVATIARRDNLKPITVSNKVKLDRI